MEGPFSLGKASELAWLACNRALARRRFISSKGASTNGGKKKGLPGSYTTSPESESEWSKPGNTKLGIRVTFHAICLPEKTFQVAYFKGSLGPGYFQTILSPFLKDPK